MKSLNYGEKVFKFKCTMYYVARRLLNEIGFILDLV